MATELELGDVVYVNQASETTGKVIGSAMPVPGGAQEGDLYIDFGERGVQRYPAQALTKVETAVVVEDTASETSTEDASESTAAVTLPDGTGNDGSADTVPADAVTGATTPEEAAVGTNADEAPAAE